MADNLLILAGKRALSVLREQGLSPDSIDVIAGAAGGPKWLVLNGLDRAIFFNWITPKTHPLFLVGSSIGVWRFAALAQGAASGAYDRFEHDYLHQRYSARPTPLEVTRESLRIMDAFLGENEVPAVLSHPYFRLNMLTVRCQGLFAKENRYALGPAMLLAGMANALSRKALRRFFSRTLVYDPRDIPPFFDMEQFPLQRVPLTETNLRPALLASGSIPLVMAGVTNIPGASPGVYRDGGLLDYHLDIPFRNQGLVLYPHYQDRIVPGWFDKLLPWRKPNPHNMENVVLLCPARTFIERLPYGKIPDRDDFFRFRHRDRERIGYWEKVVQASRILGEEFLEQVHGQHIPEKIKPLPFL